MLQNRRLQGEQASKARSYTSDSLTLRLAAKKFELPSGAEAPLEAVWDHVAQVCCSLTLASQ